MNILVATAEVSPLAKAGGLADVASFLPNEWEKFGHNPVVVLPKYSHIHEGYYGFYPTDKIIYVPMAEWTEFARLWTGFLPGSKVPVYLVENNDYFNREGIYGNPNEYQDNDRRFIFFSRAVLETAKAIGFKPDILHAHDYHAAFSLAFLKTHYRNDPYFSHCAGVFTIHNLAYQGWFNGPRALNYAQIGLDQLYPGSWFEKFGQVNAMKTGIMFADKITTVSPTYSHEIRNDYFGEGLQNELNQRSGDLVGILNGVYYSEWNPEEDKMIYQNYNQDNLYLKQENKRLFLNERGVSDWADWELPLVGIVSRFAEQKGIDILMWKMDEYLGNNTFRLAVLGSGEQRYEDYFKYLKWKYPGRIVLEVGYNNALSHKIIAASDFFLMPSRYEPCGLTQMYALRYGTIPIVRSTGGLADTVFEYNPNNGKGTGFLFNNYNAEDMAYAIHRALQAYHSDSHWQMIRQNAMNEDFSSTKTAIEYIKVFNWALEKVK